MIAILIITTILFLILWIVSLCKNTFKTHELGLIVDKGNETSPAELSTEYYFMISYRKAGTMYTDKIKVSQDAYMQFKVNDKVII